MKKLDKRKQMYIAVLFTVALLIGIGYAFLNSTLNITGNTKIKENSWDVHFENFSSKSGSVTATSAGINSAGTAVNYTVTLQKPGDFYEFTVDVVNEGSIDAMINTISNTGLTSAQTRYMTYSVEYSDGTAIAEKQLLAAETGKETIKVKVEYKKDITASDLPTTEQTISLTFSVNYVQADGSAVAVRELAVCKRATTLHKPYASQTATYGNLGTAGTLASGDAFDCDVNGDGSYNAENERFYYVSPLDTNSDYAVLIYYTNMTSSGVKYDEQAQSGGDLHGPITAKTYLPTTSQWKNVSLSSTTRNILDETGAVKVSNFSYEGYAARPITYQEVVAACGAGTPTSDGYLDNCSYFKEGSSSLGYWLETYYSGASNNSAWTLGYTTWSQKNIIYGSSAAFYSIASARPAIEVPKSKISY